MIAALVLVVGAQPAAAGLANSPYGYYGPYLGWSYRNQATIVTNSNSAWAYTYAETTNSGNVPAGYIGVLARMYRSNGALCSQRGYTYNSSPLHGMSEGTFVHCGSGTYYSYGVSQAYTGSGYQSVYTFRSPNQSF